jgi:hypothetical protein
MKRPNGVRTSSKIAKLAAKEMRSKSSSKATKRLAGEALSDRRKRS